MKINKKGYRQGFTLVELIVVLVILAILIALLVPALTGYIKKAKEKASLSNAHAFYNAVQSVAVEDYGSGKAYSDEVSGPLVTYEAITNTRPEPNEDPYNRRIKEIYKLMEMGSIKQKFEAIAIVDKGTVTIMRYKDIDLKTVFEWTKEKSSWIRLNISDNAPWAGEILPDSYTDRDIYWNGYAP